MDRWCREGFELKRLGLLGGRFEEAKAEKKSSPFAVLFSLLGV